MIHNGASWVGGWRDGTRRAAWQWQPTIEAHDPSPPIVLQDPTIGAHPIEAAFIESAAAVHGPVVGATVSAAAIGSASEVPAPAVGASIVAGFVESAAEVYAPDVGEEAPTAPPPVAVVGGGGGGSSRGRPGRLFCTVEDARIDWKDEVEVLLLSLAAIADED